MVDEWRTRADLERYLDEVEPLFGAVPSLQDPEPLRPFKALRRADGEHIWDEYAWMCGDEWAPAEDSDEDEVVWEVCEMRPVLIERRTYRYGQWVEDPDREMCQDCGADHLGTGSVCDV